MNERRARPSQTGSPPSMNGVEPTTRTGASRETFDPAPGGGLAGELNFGQLTVAATRQASLFATSADEREGIAQEAIARAWERRATFDAARGSPEAWMFGLVRNVAREQYRDRRRREALRERLRREEPTGADDQIAVHDAITRLAPAEQEVLFLRYWERLSHDEIARQLGITSAACRQRVRRAMVRLGRLLR